MLDLFLKLIVEAFSFEPTLSVPVDVVGVYAVERPAS
jgi:hypothetical protein